MSHIDSFKHEIVGCFGGLPVYHPLELIEGDFRCTPEQLVLGGGSGEHPALVFENLTACVALFLKDCILKNKKLTSWSPIITPYLTKDPDTLVTFYDWKEETSTAFLNLCSSNGLPCPFEAHYHTMGWKTWLLMGVGEFVFFALPQMAAPIMNQLQAPYQHFFSMEYNNIMLLPPNVPVYANSGNMFFKKVKA